MQKKLTALQATSTQDTKKRLALAIIDFLNTSATDGSIASDERESIEVATGCIADAFKVDPEDKAAAAAAVSPGQNLLSIYSVYEKLRGKSTPSTTGPSSAGEARPATPATSSTSKDTSSSSTAAGTSASNAKNPEAEGLKGQGNVAMQSKNYASAIDLYTRAIALSPTNPIYLSNRAAAYSATQQHDLARQDAELAVAADPKYTKAWSRLGLARFALGDAKGSMEAYKDGIDAEGNGGSEAMRKGYETAKRRAEEQGAAGNDDDDEEEDDDVLSASRGGGAGGMPDLSSLAGMFGGGGGGGGGMPDLAGIMNNPMMQQMAQRMMSNPDMMSNIMSNPRVREMANSLGGAGGAGAGRGAGGGGMPDFSSLMNDPSIAEM